MVISGFACIDFDPVFFLCLSTVVSQFYITEAENEYVIRGNAAILKCKIPSFVADFVLLEAWIADDSKVYKYNENDKGIATPNLSFFSCIFLP